MKDLPTPDASPTDQAHVAEMLAAHEEAVSKELAADEELLTEEELFAHRLTVVRPLLLRIAEFQVRDVGCRQDAEDLVQEASIRMWESRDGFSGKGSYVGWSATILLNLWKDKLRRPDPEQVSFDKHEHLVEPHPDGEEVRWRQEQATVLDAALEQLEPREREVLLAHCLDGLSVSEVGRKLDVSRKTASDLVRQACRRLRGTDAILELALDDEQGAV